MQLSAHLASDSDKAIGLALYQFLSMALRRRQSRRCWMYSTGLTSKGKLVPKPILRSSAAVHLLLLGLSTLWEYAGWEYRLGRVQRIY